MKPTLILDGGRIRLWRADCRDVLPSIPPGKIDAVVTDPPYGIGFEYEGHDDSLEAWAAMMDDVVPLLRETAPFVIMPCCQIERLSWWYEHHKPDWLVAWYKGSPGHRAKVGFNDWEPHVCWGRPAKPMHDYFSTKCGFTENGHPCPKPIEYARWLVSRAAIVNAWVADSFMGSATTGVACLQTGRRFVGIEKVSKYFDLAVDRLRAAIAKRESSMGILAT